MVGHNLPPDWDSVNVSENLGKAAALPALPLITHLFKLYVHRSVYIPHTLVYRIDVQYEINVQVGNFLRKQ